MINAGDIRAVDTIRYYFRRFQTCPIALVTVMLIIQVSSSDCVFMTFGHFRALALACSVKHSPLVQWILLSCQGRDSNALDRETHRGERSEQVTRCGVNAAAPPASHMAGTILRYHIQMQEMPAVGNQSRL